VGFWLNFSLGVILGTPKSIVVFSFIYSFVQEIASHKFRQRSAKTLS